MTHHKKKKGRIDHVSASRRNIIIDANILVLFLSKYKDCTDCIPKLTSWRLINRPCMYSGENKEKKRKNGMRVCCNKNFWYEIKFWCVCVCVFYPWNELYAIPHKLHVLICSCYNSDTWATRMTILVLNLTIVMQWKLSVNEQTYFSRNEW
jgi:hypothetical protein